MFQRTPENNNPFRKNDYANKKIGNKPLSKHLSLFKPSGDRALSSGACSFGPYLKQGIHSDTSLFYLAPHCINEYFASEIVLRIGILTPRCRVLCGEDEIASSEEVAWNKTHKKPTIASKSIDGFIPVGLIHRYNRFGERLGEECVRYLSEKEKEIRSRYEFDMINQLIYDRMEKKHYRLSGNFFGSDVAAILIDDYDFQPSGNNFGVVKAGRRFYAVAIDKEKASFSGKSYKEIKKHLPQIYNVIYQARMHDQLIAVVYQVAQALAVDNNNQCDFDRIFSNTRVRATGQLSISSDYRCENIKKTASSIVEHYKKIYGNDFLEKYEEREALRLQIANVVMEGIDKHDGSLEEDVIRNIIIEDLRGPYYKDFLQDKETKVINKDDLDNIELLNAILTDVISEHGLTLSTYQKPTCPRIGGFF